MPFPLPDFAQDLLMPLLHEAQKQGLALICMQQIFADQDAQIYFMQDGHYQQHGSIPAAQYQPLLQALQRSTSPPASGQTDSALEFQLNKTLLPEWRSHLRVNGILLPTQQGGTVLTLEFADVGIALFLQSCRLDDMLATELTSNRAGLILLASPPNAYRATLAQILLDDAVNQRYLSAMTIHGMPCVGLRGVVDLSPCTGDFTARTALAIRAHADIVDVGQIDDASKLDCILQLAAGRMVVASVRAHSLVDAMRRILAPASLMQRELLIEVLRTVVVEQLVPRICRHCRQEQDFSMEALKTRWQSYVDHAHTNEFPAALEALACDENTKRYRAIGCEQCKQTGYLGRAPLHALLRVTPKLRKQLQQLPVLDEHNLRPLFAQYGATSLPQDGLRRYLCGEVDLLTLDALFDT